MNQVGYAEFIRNGINARAVNQLFTAEEVCRETADNFDADKDKLQYTVNVILNRMIGAEILRYQKGVYYRPQRTVFGFVPLSPAEMVYKEYVEDGDEIIGYITGPTLCQKLGLTTQVPKQRFYATNKVKGREKIIDFANTVLRPGKTEITEGNYKYLQILDVIDDKDGTPHEVQDRDGKIIEIIDKFNLDYTKLLGTAKRYYPKKVVDRLVNMTIRRAL